jgi:hypothetical protein
MRVTGAKSFESECLVDFLFLLSCQLSFFFFFFDAPIFFFDKIVPNTFKLALGKLTVKTFLHGPKTSMGLWKLFQKTYRETENPASDIRLGADSLKCSGKCRKPPRCKNPKKRQRQKVCFCVILID